MHLTLYSRQIKKYVYLPVVLISKMNDGNINFHRFLARKLVQNIKMLIHYVMNLRRLKVPDCHIMGTLAFSVGDV